MSALAAPASLILFLAFTFGVPALGARTATRVTRADAPGSRPWWWHLGDALFVLGWLVIAAGALLPALGVTDVPDPDVLTVAAAALALACGAGLVRWAQATMGRAWRPDIPPVPGAQLVTGGPFAVVRHPNYVGMLLAALGVALLAPGPVTAAGWALLLAGLLLVARAEESALLARHGAAYAAYAARVGRLVPGVGRRR